MATPVIIGGGLAGLAAALAMAPRPVVVIGRAPLLRQTSSELAQGGMAVAIGADDSVEDHVADTLAAGAGPRGCETPGDFRKTAGGSDQANCFSSHFSSQ